MVVSYMGDPKSSFIHLIGREWERNGDPWRTMAHLNLESHHWKTWIKTLFKQLDIQKSKVWPKSQDITYFKTSQSVSAPVCFSDLWPILIWSHVVRAKMRRMLGLSTPRWKLGSPEAFFSVKTPRRSMGFNGMYTIYGEDWLKDILKKPIVWSQVCGIPLLNHGFWGGG